MQQKIRNKFQELFSTKGSVYASPGRINLIGEHTDYNGGFVFPGGYRQRHDCRNQTKRHR